MGGLVFFSNGMRSGSDELGVCVAPEIPNKSTTIMKERHRPTQAQLAGDYYYCVNEKKKKMKGKEKGRRSTEVFTLPCLPNSHARKLSNGGGPCFSSAQAVSIVGNILWSAFTSVLMKSHVFKCMTPRLWS